MPDRKEYVQWPLSIRIGRGRCWRSGWRKPQTTRHRVVLNVVLEHAKLESEPVWDLDRLMATLSPSPACHFWVGGVDVGPKGADGVRSHYAEMVRTRTNLFELAVDRLVVDDDCVLTEGFMKQIYPGSEAARIGIAVDDPGAHNLVVFRTLVILPVDQDGLIEGEDAYISGPASVTKLSRDELPQPYVDLV
jgi:hypothetical protein